MGSMTTGYPSVQPDDIGWVTESQMVEVDRILVDELGIELLQMMENAGRHLAEVVIDRFAPRTVTVLAGAGGNGGGGLVAARHLTNRGVDVSVTLGSEPSALTPVPAHQLAILHRMGITSGVAIDSDKPDRSDVVIDALIGYSLKGAPRGRIASLIEGIDSVGEHVVSLDTPSGLDVDDGSRPGAVVAAALTLTLALPKVGLRNAPAVGELYLADISVPSSVYTTIGVGPAPDFSGGQILWVLPG